MGGARHERQHEERITLASQERIKCAWFWCWWLRSTYGKPWALRWLEALKGFGRARKGIFRFAAVSALVLFFFTSTAYAIEGFNSVIYGPVSYTWQNVTYSQIGVIASNKYNAAAVSLGYNPDDFSADVKAKLSNASTGGTFYTFAQEFVNPDPDGLSVTMQGVSPGFWATCYGLYGEGNVWYAEVTKNSMVSAKEDLEAILNGGNLGGGGNADFESQGWHRVVLGANLVPFSGTDSSNLYNVYDNPTVSVNDSGVGSVSGGTSGTKISFDTQGTVVMYIDPYSYDYIRQNGYDINCYIKGSGVPYVITSEYEFEFVRTSSNSNYVVRDVSGMSNRQKSIGGGSSNFYRVNGEVCCFMVQAGTYRTYTVAANSKYGTPLSPWWNSFGTPSGGLTPPSNWPDAPTVGTPEPPEVPDPTNDTPTPQPTGPTFEVNPTFPIYVDVSTTTYTADLQGILDAMNDHCIHLQNALHTNFSDFWTSLSTKMTNDFATLRQYLHGQFSWLGETIQDEFSETRDYLKELFEWLADQFDYSISGGAYNDNTVVSWLKKIYSKLGTGTSSKPVDPVADPDETGSWLDTLINNLLTALEDVFPGLIGQVADFFGGALGNLTQKFPFSIPWDVAAILGMLVAEPVAPSVEIPAYTLTAEGLTQAGSYDIDLSAYDAAWGAVRIMMRIAFALYVCVHTKDFLEVIERVMM